MDNQQVSLSMIEKKENALPFYALVFFTFMVYITPQAYVPVLEPLHLAKLSAGFAVATYILNALGRKQPLLKIDTETRLLFVIIFFAIISIPFSIWPGGSFGVFKDFYIKAIIIFLLIPNVVTSTKRLKVMLWSIIFFCTFMSIIAIRDFVTGNFWQLDRIKGAGWGIAANPNDLALTVVLSIPFAMSFYLLYKNGLKKLISAAYIIIATYAVICTFSRGGLITLVVVYTVFIVKNIKKSGAKVIIPTVFLLIIFLSLIPGGYKEKMSSMFDFQKDKTGSALSRKEGIVQGAKIMLDNPLFGVGLGMNILALNKKGGYWTQTHNVYLEIGSEIGIPAMIIFLILLYKLVRGVNSIQKKCHRSLKSKELFFLAEGIEISLIGFFIAALFHPVAYHFYFYYIAGFVLALKNIYRNSILETERGARNNTLVTG